MRPSGRGSKRPRGGGRGLRSRPAILAVVCGLAAGAPGLSGCRRVPEPGARPQEPRFAEITEAAGAARTTQTYDAALADFDVDGRPDVFVGNHAASAVLLRNEGGSRLVDVTAASGIDASGDKHGAAWGDADGDGRPDLYVSLGAGRGTQRKRNRLYRNEGNGRFRDVAEEAGVTDPTGRSRSVAWLDVDRDGRLDLFVGNYATPNRLFLNRPDGRFVDASAAWGVGEPGATRVAWGDLDDDGAPDLILTGTPGNLRVLHNESGRGFVDATRAAGLDGIPHGVSAVALGDVDGDGDQDLYTAFGSDFSDVALDQGDGSVRFAFFAGESPVGLDLEEVAGTTDGITLEVLENGAPLDAARIRCGRDQPIAAAQLRCAGPGADASEMPVAGSFVAWRDPLPRSSREAGGTPRRWHLRWREPGDHHVSGVVRGVRAPRGVGFTHSAERGGALWLGDGAGHFAVSTGSGIEHAANVQVVDFADANGDGVLDLYVVDSGVDGAGGRNLLFLGRGDGTFAAASGDAGVSPDPGGGRPVGASFFDFDGDGRLDLFLTNGWGAPPFDQGPHRLLRNVTEPLPAWLAVELRGTRSNRFGLGARVEATACGRRQVRLHDGMGSGYSQSLLPIPFAFGSCREEVRLRVRWPSGAVQRVDGPTPGQVLRLEEDTPASGAGGGGPAARDVVLVVIDTLRADHLPLYGYARDTAPSLTKLAQDAVTYRNAISPGTWTVPSHASMFTGLWPSFHGAERLPGETTRAHPIRRDASTLAELLAAQGFHTAAFVGNATFVTPVLGFGRGFAEYHDRDLTHPPVLAEAVTGWLRAQPADRRLFLFVNVLDPHEPYAPPPPLDSLFPTRHPELGTMMTRLVFAGEPVTPRMTEHFRSQYDGEIVLADAAVGRIVQALRDAGRLGDALVVVTSDHGEYLGEHGRAGHGQEPLEPQVHVPLVVRHPGARRGGEVVARRVSTRTLFGTVLQAAGLAPPVGETADTLDAPQAVWVEDVASDGTITVAGYAGDEKLLAARRAEPSGAESTTTALYDLAEDAAEEHPERGGAGSPELRAALAAFVARARPPGRESAPTVDPEREAQLRALGYVR